MWQRYPWSSPSADIERAKSEAAIQKAKEYLNSIQKFDDELQQLANANAIEKVEVEKAAEAAEATIDQRVSDLESEVAELKDLINRLLKEQDDSRRDAQEDPRLDTELEEIWKALCKPA